MTKNITSAQAMSHPAVVETINALGQMCDELRAAVEQLTKDALRYRWLREEARSVDWSASIKSPIGKAWRSYCKNGCDMDAIIDYEMPPIKPTKE